MKVGILLLMISLVLLAGMTGCVIDENPGLEDDSKISTDSGASAPDITPAATSMAEPTLIPYERESMEPTIFYFDSITGSDSNPGTSEDAPLKNVIILNHIPMVPGDTYLLRCGSEWTVTLSFTDSGTAEQPIVLSSYGAGAKPILRSIKDHQAAVRVGGSYFTISNLHLASANLGAGFQLTENSQNVIIENNEIEQVGIGISVFGSGHIIRGNHIHDLLMIRNTEGGNDDFGAVGIWIYHPAEHIKIYRNRLYRCKAPSFDYVYDGGVLETWGSVSDIEFFQNYSEENNGFFEGGSAHNSTVSDLSIHHNISVNDLVAFLPHLKGTFAIRLINVNYSNNTFVNTIPSRIGFFPISKASLNATQLVIRNNVFSNVNDIYQFIDDGFVHEGNLYFTPASIHTDSNFILSPDEASADPLFSNYSEAGYQIECNSPAIDQGKRTDFLNDFLGNPIYANGLPDRGAIESQDNGKQICQ